MVMEFLWRRRAPNLPPAGLADVFDRLVWCMDDNGAEVLAVRAKWLAGDDIERVRVALAMTEAYPCGTRSEIASLCERLTSRWPELQPECESLVRRWDQQHGSHPSNRV